MTREPVSHGLRTVFESSMPREMQPYYINGMKEEMRRAKNAMLNWAGDLDGGGRSPGESVNGTQTHPILQAASQKAEIRT